MKTLILNVDRDDDFGRKAKVKSPIVGIRDNIEAANKLGLVDPEDSDLNAIFSAISTYNKLKDEEKQVEVATICGNIKVGIKSDQILATQLEQVIEKTGTDNVILITDGAEDEYILPIIQSRIKVTSISRVSVKQSKELEDTYYRILKLLDDEKVQKQFILPIALVLIVGALFVLLDMASSGFGAILLTLGAFLLIRVFRWERNIAIAWEEIKSSFLTGKLSIWTTIIAIIILVAFFLFAYYNTNFESKIELVSVFQFLTNMVWGITLAGLIAVFGRAIDVYVNDKKIPLSYYVLPFSLIAFGFISYAVSSAFYQALKYSPALFNIVEEITEVDFIFYTIAGVLVAILGAIIHHFIRDIRQTKEKEMEIEKQTTPLVEKN